MAEKPKEISQREIVLKRMRQNKKTGHKPKLRKSSLTAKVPCCHYPDGIGRRNPTYH